MTVAPRSPVEMIPISQITVLNPRSRSARQHREIVKNIEAVGLKRPITVSRRTGPDGPIYHLVCGEGRLSAFQMLQQREIPAVVIEASEDECLIMSLVENIARRVHRPIDLIKEIGALRRRGQTETAIAKKIGVSPSWVNLVLTLIERGEDRLLAAVETGLVPITLAMEISRAESGEAQGILLDAYEKGDLRGKKLAAVRRLLDARIAGQAKGLPPGRFGRKRTGRRLTPNELMEIYQREADKQRLLVKKSDFVQHQLMFVVEAMRDLLDDDGFRTLLRAEGLYQVPRWLEVRLSGNGRD